MNPIPKLDDLRRNLEDANLALQACTHVDNLAGLVRCRANVQAEIKRLREEIAAQEAALKLAELIKPARNARAG